MLLILYLFATAAAEQVVLSSPKYAITVGDLGEWTTPIDTPAFSFIDTDGTYWFQQSEAEYEIDASRVWEFYSGDDIDTAKLHPVTHAADPNEPRDSNANTTWRCNYRSPTGREASFPPTLDPNRYNQANYCDLMGLWVDPDSGAWHGLVHNEFTPSPYGDRLHFDAIDLAVSHDLGATWNITEHILTSPYPTVRGDAGVFSQDTYYWGAGDQRLLTDLSSGYFYVWYGSRVVDKNGTWVLFYTHAARAPMKDKMAAGSWKKWYDGKWEEPGLGGRESSIVPTSWEKTGYVPPEKEYKPSTPGKAAEQAEKGTAPRTTPLFWMDVSYNAYLGMWIGQPNNLDRSGDAPQEFYGTHDLSTQQWTLLGDTGDYRTASNYRWLIDAGTRTSQAIVGRDFRSYCSYGCSGGRDGEYVNLAIEGPPATEVDTAKSLFIGTNSGQYLATRHGRATSNEAGVEWRFTSTADGAYTISDSRGLLLGVDARPRGRAWGTVPHVAAETEQEPTAQHWWVIPSRATNNSREGTFRLVNRYSGLVLALSGDGARRAETTPGRFWTAPVGRSRADQELVFVQRK